MADEKETNSNSKIPFTNVLEILANKVSRKAAVVGMAMVLIYLLAIAPATTAASMYIIAISGLAVFFTVLQWIIDLKNDDVKKKKKKDAKMGGAITDEGKDDK